MPHPLAIEELDRIDALRPPCPTCGGTTIIQHTPGEMPDMACPDCVDGKVSIEQLVATYNAVHGPRQIGGLSADDMQDYLRGVKP